MEAIIVILAVTIVLVFRYIWDGVSFPRKLAKLNAAFERSDFETVLNEINTLSKDRKKLPPVQWLLARVYFQQSQFIMAMVHLNEIVNANAYSREIPAIDVHTMLASIYERTGKPKKAVEEYEEIIKLDQSNVTAFTKTGTYYYTNNDYEKAAPYLEKSLALDENNAEILYMLAVISTARKDNESALRYAESCLVIDPNYNKAVVLRGRLLYSLKRNDEAKKDLLTAYNISECKMDAAIFLGRMASEEGDAESAYRFFSDGLTLNNNTDEDTMHARYEFAILLGTMKRLQESLEQFRIIRNARMTMLDVEDRIETYSKILSNPALRDVAHADIADYLDETLYKILSKSGYAVIENKEVSSGRIFFVTLKKIGGGMQAYRTSFALDTSLNVIGVDDIHEFNDYIKDKRAHNSFYFSLGGFEPNVRASLPAPIELFDADKFEQVISGKLSI
ncbi:MAG: tetratricopeptide repeat protein [Spirochaetes bacterium]|nr:tetratricopeptide repeat protein [Spirochaetota bacterium]